ncbi:MAG: class I SAM-dependent methyltransferase [Anaerolineales bacterium]|nr:MAG: class I SAM-dependent methyltransferase [Anaerolineales bacterium]
MATDPQHPPICDYEGSDYQTRFWEQGGRAYEDGAEEIALRRLLPKHGKLMLEVGAGAGRNTPRYAGYERIVVMDYSTTQLEQAQQYLGESDRYVYVAADVYKLPFVDGLFDGATMIRVLHHMADAPAALAQIRQTLQPKATFILEYANKRNLKSILRWLLGRQKWSPFNHEPVEYIELNFDFHPAAITRWLRELGFRIERQLAVSHFRLGWLKRNVPTRLLVWLDGLFQPLGAFWKFTPSIFVRSRLAADAAAAAPGAFFKCPECGAPLAGEPKTALLQCSCGLRWGRTRGIWNFKKPAE